ncbi:hypothetical protein JCM6882_000755 [Rhodosporidiobolus microsporus]
MAPLPAALLLERLAARRQAFGTASLSPPSDHSLPPAEEAVSGTLELTSNKNVPLAEPGDATDMQLAEAKDDDGSEGGADAADKDDGDMFAVERATDASLRPSRDPYPVPKSPASKPVAAETQVERPNELAALPRKSDGSEAMDLGTGEDEDGAGEATQRTGVAIGRVEGGGCEGGFARVGEH